jgi:hypothetical protein
MVIWVLKNNLKNLKQLPMWNSHSFDNNAPIIMNGANGTPGIYGNAIPSYLPMHVIENSPQILPQMQTIMIQPQLEIMMPLQSRVVQLVQQPILQIQTQRNFSPPPSSPQLLRSPTERKTPERAKVERSIERAEAPESPPKPEWVVHHDRFLRRYDSEIFVWFRFPFTSRYQLKKLSRNESLSKLRRSCSSLKQINMDGDILTLLFADCYQRSDDSC